MKKGLKKRDEKKGEKKVKKGEKRCVQKGRCAKREVCKNACATTGGEKMVVKKCCEKMVGVQNVRKTGKRLKRVKKEKKEKKGKKGEKRENMERGKKREKV